MNEEIKQKLEDHLDQQMVRPQPAELQNLEARRFEDDFDKIYLHYSNPDLHPLSETLIRQKARWDFLRELESGDEYFKNDRQLARPLIEKFKISEPQARIDIRNMRRFYSKIDEVNLQFEKVMAIERVKRYMHMAEKMGEKGFKMLPGLVKEYHRLIGVGEEKPELPAPVQITMNIMYNPEAVGGKLIPDLEQKAQALIEKAKLKESQKREYTDFEELEK